MRGPRPSAALLDPRAGNFPMHLSASCHPLPLRGGLCCSLMYFIFCPAFIDIMQSFKYKWIFL